MPNPQQPELRRSAKGASTDESLKGHLTADVAPGEEGETGPVPEANRPGHHPEVEQDKPASPPA